MPEREVKTMNIKLDCTDHDLFTASEELHTAWQKARKAQDTINDIEESRKNHSHACELFGAYYTVARLLGSVSDTDWQSFLNGDK
jgi:hypothetical protein